MLNQRKILPFLMLLIVTAPLLFLTGFLFKQTIIQYQMEEKLEKDVLQTITVDKTDFRWVKINKEAFIKGKIFDVISFTASGDVITVTGLFDEDEDFVMKELNDLVTQKTGDSSPVDDLVTEFFSLSFYNANTNFTIAADWLYIVQLYRNYAAHIPEHPLFSDIRPPKPTC